jgi:short-subunit dehydrogenase
MAQLRGRRVLLTGASSGIGRAAAMKLAAGGAQLAVVARRRERLEELADEAVAAGGPRPIVLEADLSTPGSAVAVATEAVDALGSVDVLVNNAGASVQGLSWIAGDRDEARAVFETNLWSPLALIAALAPAMVERGEGAIVNTGSMARVSAFPHLGHYCASRAALSLATQTLRMELGPRGVRVVELALGPVDTAGSYENRLLSGAGGWLDGGTGIGKLDAAAAALVEAVTQPVEGVVYYPRLLRAVDAVPALGRRYARRAARNADLSDSRFRAGADPELVRQRAEWEAGRASRGSGP